MRIMSQMTNKHDSRSNAPLENVRLSIMDCRTSRKAVPRDRSSFAGRAMPFIWHCLQPATSRTSNLPSSELALPQVYFGQANGI
jgi:hypothetical protein